MEASPRTRKMRFGAFEVDLRSGEVYKHGIRLKLQDQPFQVLALLLEHAGDVVTREELRQKLWPADTFVDFDTGLNSAIKKLRDVAERFSRGTPLHRDAAAPRLPLHRSRRKRRTACAGPIEMRARAPFRPSRQSLERSEQTPHCCRGGWPSQRSSLLPPSLRGASISLGLALTESDVILLASFVNKTGDPIFDDTSTKPSK